MAKILLVKLSNAMLYQSKNLTLLEPLGLEYIASAIDKEHIVSMLDMDYCELTDLIEWVQNFEPDFVGTTVSTPMVQEAAQLSHIVHKMLPDCKVLVGGGHPSALLEGARKDTGADIAIVGEGESIINDVIKNPDSQIYYGRPLPINEIEPPARHLLPREKYQSSYSFRDDGKLQRCASVITSRGCPFPCNYCASKKILGKAVRYRDAGLVIDEVEDLVSNYDVEAILFLDDCFTLDELRVVEMCEQIIKRGLKFHWWLDTRVDCISEELLNLMYVAGCRFIVYGVESGCQAVLDRIGKKIKVDDIISAFEMTKRVGIDTKANFMFGHIDETREEIMESIDLAKTLDATRYGFYLTLPLPGSALYDIAVERKALTKSFNRYKWYDEPVSTISKVPSDELVGLQKRAYIDCAFKK